MYEMRSSSNLSILLGIDDISDAMRFAENLQQIAVSDNQLITEMHDKQVKLENQREEINAALDELNAQQEELENTKTSYQQAIQRGGRDRHGRAGPAAGVTRNRRQSCKSSSSRPSRNGPRGRALTRATAMCWATGWASFSGYSGLHHPLQRFRHRALYLRRARRAPRHGRAGPGGHAHLCGRQTALSLPQRTGAMAPA